jgi:hypothetical protein
VIPQVQESLAEVMTVLGFQWVTTFHRVAISILQQLQSASVFGIFLVVEVFDVLDISVQGIEET